MPAVVLYDANVLYPAPLRDLLIRLAIAGLIRARWTDMILDECFRNVLKNRPELSSQSLERTRAMMNRAIRDVLVEGFEPLIGEISLPDPDDRHVLAAAVHCDADHIVTFNLRDFPSQTLAPLGIRAIHPDDFLLSLIERDLPEVCETIGRQTSALQNPPRTLDEVLQTLENQGLRRSVPIIRGEMLQED